ncbi:flagellar hook-length control protein FliK [Evansella halocellulosilytica]|uniref:flagellar hook-length control protein FliK n=1 Tax=Evansella halocellulosilytica TaxID=2011013 RepID=UPI000BB8F41E|nr:flagellar hook-length control protein FliK [Evansella halocellulosilytica]
MNAIVQMMASLQQMNGSLTEQKLSKEGKTDADSKFLLSLQKVLGSEETEYDLQTYIDVLEEDETFDVAQLLRMIEELLEEIPYEDGYLHMGMLELDENKRLLNVFPTEIQEAVKALFEEGTPLEELVDEMSFVNEPLQLIAFMIAIAYQEKNEAVDIDQPTIRQFEQMISKAFPNFQQLSTSSSVRELNEALAKDLERFMKSEQSGPHRSLQPDEWTRRLTQQMNEKRIAEQVYQQHATQRDSKTLSNVLPTMNVDLSNSHMSRLQQFIVHAGEQQADRPSEQQFLRQFQNILARSQFQNLGNGVQQLNIKLHPESLGRLDITIQQINGVLVAKMMTTTAVARELIEGQLQHLRNAFQAQQIQVDKIEVSQQQTAQQHSLKDQTNDESANKEETLKDDTNEEEAQGEESFADFLEETINMEV